jgi:hypothetical protein
VVATKAFIDVINEELSYWKVELGLQDFTIFFAVTRRFEMANQNVGGESSWNLARREAWVRVLDPVDYNPSIPRPDDPRYVLIHELMHVVFAPFTPKEYDPEDTESLQFIMFEWSIDSAAKALFRLKYGQDDVSLCMKEAMPDGSGESRAD